MITMPTRQTLSKRIHAFGGLNGRGVNRSYRFGDTALDRASIDTAIAGIDAGAINTRTNRELINATNWAALYQADPNYAKAAYAKLNAWTIDPESEPDLGTWLKNHGGIPDASPAPVVVPVPVANPPVVTVTTPGTTDAEYQVAVAAAQAEAARLAAEAAARAADNASSTTTVLEDGSNTVVDAPAKKSNIVPLLVAAGIGFLLLKG